MLKSLNKGISTPVAILIVIVCAALGGIVVWQYKVVKETETSKTKVYRSKEYGFKIEYPEKWCTFTQFIRKTEEHYVTFSNYCEEEKIKETRESIESDQKEKPRKDLYLFEIRISKLKHKSLEAWLKDSEEYMKSLGVSVSRTKESVGLYSGYRVCSQKDGEKRECPKVVSNGEKIYILGALYPEKCRIEKCAIFNQMLSTFRFLD